MTDSLEEFEYAAKPGRLSLSFSDAVSESMRDRTATDENIARYLTASAPSPLPSPVAGVTAQSNARAVPKAMTPGRMGFRAFQAAVRENPHWQFDPALAHSKEDEHDNIDSVLGSTQGGVSLLTDGTGLSDEEAIQLTNITVYDSVHAQSTILRMNRRLTTQEVCRVLVQRLDLSPEEAKYHTVLVVITVFDAEKRMNMHCVRTFQQDELVLNVLDILVAKLTDRYKVLDVTKMKNSTRWFFKDVRTPPIDLPEGEEATGEDSSDDEEPVSHNDLAYLAKADRKGYLLKKSSKDQNLWRKWYCVLTDHLWCIDIQRKNPTAICIRLSGMVRSSHHHNRNSSSYNNRASRGNSASAPSFFSSSAQAQGSSSRFNSSNAGSSTDFNKEDEQLHSIVINSTRGTHLLRAFSLVDQKKWIEDLHDKTRCALENDYFNMAEVIICDEENTKSNRFYRVVRDLLNIPMFEESLSLDHRSLQFTSVSEVVDEVAALHEEAALSLQLPAVTQFSEKTLEMLGLPSPMSILSQSSNSNRYGASREATHSLSRSASSGTCLDSDDDEILASRDSESGLPSSQIVSTKVRISKINPMDRTVQTSALHRIFDHDMLFTHVLRLALDILHYRELFRHDLFILPSYQRQVAVYIFVKYLLPILQIQGTKGKRESSSLDMKLIAAAIQQLSPRALQSNGFIQEERELMRFFMQAQSVLERTSTPTKSPVHQSSRQSMRVSSPTPLHDSSFADDVNTNLPSATVVSPSKHGLSPAEDSRPLNEIPENRLDLLWEIPSPTLHSVYQALFAVKRRSVQTESSLSLTGTTNSDRMRASGATRSENAFPVLNLNKSQPAAQSFWSWLVPTASAVTADHVSDFRANKSRYTTEDTEGLEDDTNYPAVDLFDDVLDQLETLLKKVNV